MRAELASLSFGCFVPTGTGMAAKLRHNMGYTPPERPVRLFIVPLYTVDSGALYSASALQHDARGKIKKKQQHEIVEKRRIIIPCLLFPTRTTG